MDKLMCDHDWVLMERPKHIKFDESGVEIVVGKC